MCRSRVKGVWGSALLTLFLLFVKDAAAGGNLTINLSEIGAERGADGWTIEPDASLMHVQGSSNEQMLVGLSVGSSPLTRLFVLDKQPEMTFWLSSVRDKSVRHSVIVRTPLANPEEGSSGYELDGEALSQVLATEVEPVGKIWSAREDSVTYSLLLKNSKAFGSKPGGKEAQEEVDSGYSGQRFQVEVVNPVDDTKDGKILYILRTASSWPDYLDEKSQIVDKSARTGQRHVCRVSSHQTSHSLTDTPEETDHNNVYPQTRISAHTTFKGQVLGGNEMAVVIVKMKLEGMGITQRQYALGHAWMKLRITGQNIKVLEGVGNFHDFVDEVKIVGNTLRLTMKEELSLDSGLLPVTGRLLPIDDTDSVGAVVRLPAHSDTDFDPGKFFFPQLPGVKVG